MFCLHNIISLCVCVCVCVCVKQNNNGRFFARVRKSGTNAILSGSTLKLDRETFCFHNGYSG